MEKFKGNIIRELNYYVYLYVDPTNNEVFYVGKGNKNRAFDHLNDRTENEKVERIKQIRRQKKEPKIEILVHGLDNNTARRLESAIIDLIGKEKLTNIVGGWKSGIYGRMSVDQIFQLYVRKNVIQITEPAILISVKKSYRYGMTDIELYDATRSSWKVGKKTRDTEIIKYAFSVYDYVIQEVYEIEQWFKAGSTFTTRKNIKTEDLYEFVGRIADESVRSKYRFGVIEGIKIPQQGFKPINV